MPDTKLVETLFEKAVDDLGLERKDKLFKLSKEQKWQIVLQGSKSKGIAAAKSHGIHEKKASGDEEERFIRLLQFERDKRKVSIDVLRSLRICLGNKPASWTKRFLDLGGLVHLTVLALKMALDNRPDVDWPAHLELILIVRALTTQKSTLLLLLTNPTILFCLVKILFSRHLQPHPHPITRAHPHIDMSADTSQCKPALKTSRPASHTRTLSPFDQPPPLTNRSNVIQLLMKILEESRVPAETEDTQTLGATLAYSIVTSVLDTSKWPKTVWSMEGDGGRGKTESVTAAPNLIPSEFTTPFSLWMHEFTECTTHMYKVWTGQMRRAADVFDQLADGTYKWQPIVAAKKEGLVGERECIAYLILNFQFAVHLIGLVPPGTVEARAETRRLLESNGLANILQKLQMCHHPVIFQGLRAYGQSRDEDEEAMAAIVAQPRRLVRRVPVRPNLREAAALGPEAGEGF
ncbi:hypothetical protein HDV00_011884 [Rhizophlyctis rosea]|nr:hypothetical protein HDV00_011884 [Rhizophlyctis rosea]